MAQVYYSITRWHKGKIQNKRNLKRAARQCNIPNPLALSLAEVLQCIEECEQECKFYQENGKRFRLKHLNERMHLAQERNDEIAFKRKGAIIQRERQRSFWQRLNYVTGKKQTHSATTVQVEEQLGLVSESTTKDAVKDAIFTEVHDKQHMLAKEAPICSGKLFNDFGYVANTPASRAVLDGTYQAPTDSDSATKELFAEIAAIRSLSPKSWRLSSSPRSSGRDIGPS